MRRQAVLSLAFVFLSLSPVSAWSDVKVRYFKGEPTYVSTKANGVVQVALPPRSKDRRTALGLVALNMSQQPFSVGYENVAIRTVAGAPVTLLTYEILQHKARVRAGWTTFFAAVVAGANSYAAQQSAYGTSHTSGYVSTPYGSVRSSYASSYYSPVAAQIGQSRASAENSALFASIGNQLDATLAKLDGSVLRTTTVDPGAAFGGLVVFDLPKGVRVADLIVTITYAGEVHEIALDGTTGSLDQATAEELSNPIVNRAPPAAGNPAPGARTDVVATVASTDVPRPSSNLTRAAKSEVPVSQADAPKCGMIKLKNTSTKFVPC